MIDNIEDPQNLGHIVRTAECCGVEGIIIPKQQWKTTSLGIIYDIYN